MSEVVALLLDDAMPAERLGSLLRAARKRRGLSRKQAAVAVGLTPVKLRRYERGDKTVPAAVCARLAECYGEDLTAHVPLRVPPRLDDRRLILGRVQQTIGPDTDDVVAGFVDIVQRLRDAEPGEPLALRATDIIALGVALGRDRDEIEQRIADALGCSRTVARNLHSELLRRKVILPVAGLAAGVAAFAGAAYTTHTPAAGVRVGTQTVDTTPATALQTTTPPTTQARPTTSTTLHSVPTTTPPVVRQVTPTTERHLTDATVPPEQQAPDVPSLAPPQPDPNDPPVSILPGETPITIIGTADSTSDTP